MATTEPTTPPGWVYWPTSIRDCPIDWTEESVDLRVRTNMSVGPPKTRRRFTSPMRKATFSILVENQYVPILRAFYEGSGQDHSGGTEGGYKFFKFTNPLDYLDHYYRFVSPPKFTTSGALHTRASFEIEEL